MVLKGMIDANKASLPRRYFWNNFWYVHATGIIGMAIRNKHGGSLPKRSELPPGDPILMRNPAYARGYNARIYTRGFKLIAKGQIMGLFLPPLVFL